MSVASLRDFISALDTDGEVVHVQREVSPIHELSAVVKALEKRGNPVVIFDNVEGSRFPVVVGIHGTRERIDRALSLTPGRALDDYIERLARPLPPELLDNGPVRDVRYTGDDVDLGQLPIAVHAPDDGGRYITSGVCLVNDPASGATNAGIYRTMIKDRARATVSVDAGQDLAILLDQAQRDGRTLECAIVIGGHPALSLSSQAKVSVTVDCLALAGSLAGSPLPVVRGETIDMNVPADAEFVLEGRLLPDAREPEGPFGEFSYYYGSSLGTVCEITALHHRRDAMWVDIHPTHVEHRCLATYPAKEAHLLSLLRRSVQGVRAVRMPFEGAGMVAHVAIDKRHDGDARRAMSLVLSSDTIIKHVVVVDSDIDIDDLGQVLWALAVRFQADRDLLVLPNTRGFAEDPSSYGDGLTTKTGFDATIPAGRPFPQRADILPEGYADLKIEDYVSTPTGA